MTALYITIILCAALLPFTFAASVTQNTTPYLYEYYISNITNNACEGNGTIDCPFYNIQTAVDYACSISQVGNILWFLPGRYNIDVNVYSLTYLNYAFANITCEVSLQSTNGSENTIFSGLYSASYWVEYHNISTTAQITIKGFSFADITNGCTTSLSKSLIIVHGKTANESGSVLLEDISTLGLCYEKQIIDVSGFQDVTLNQIFIGTTSKLQKMGGIILVEATGSAIVTNIELTNFTCNGTIFSLTANTINVIHVNADHLIMNMLGSYWANILEIRNSTFMSLAGYVNASIFQGSANLTIIDNLEMDTISNFISGIFIIGELRMSNIRGYNINSFATFISNYATIGKPNFSLINGTFNRIQLNTFVTSFSGNLKLENLSFENSVFDNGFTFTPVSDPFVGEIRNCNFNHVGVRYNLIDIYGSGGGNFTLIDSNITRCTPSKYFLGEPSNPQNEVSTTTLIVFRDQGSTQQTRYFNIINCIFRENLARLLVSDQPVMVVNSQIQNNSFVKGTLFQLLGSPCVNCVGDFLLFTSLFQYNIWYNNTGDALLESTMNIVYFRNETFLSNTLALNGLKLTQSQVEMVNCTFEGMNITSDGAAIVKSSDSLVSIEHTKFTNNIVSAGSVACVGDSVMEIFFTHFSNNSADYGGGVYSFDQCILTVANSSFIDGRAEYQGAGMWIGGCSRTNITGCRFDANIAKGSGGGISINGNSNVTVEFGEFKGNVALTGGCISLSENTLANFTITNFAGCTSWTTGGAVAIGGYSHPIFISCNFFQNYASSVGSAIFAAAYASPSVIYSNIYDNYSPNEGGGMYVQDRANVSLMQVSFWDNRALSSGGALLMTVNSTGLISNCEFRNNTSGSKGGAIALLNRCTPIFINTIIVQNTATSGGGCYATDISKPTFYHCAISDNFATSRAGGLYANNNVTLFMHSCIINNNTAVSGPGGGLLVQDLCRVDINNCTIWKNVATYGGGMYVISEVSPVINDTLLTNNHALYDGGALVLGENSTAEISNSKCVSNTAGNLGGCLIADDTASILIYRTNLDNNQAGIGGAISINGKANLRMAYSTLMNNTAVAQGGAISFSNLATASLSNTLIFNNSSPLGGGVYQDGSAVQYFNVSFTANTANMGGGLVLSFDASLQPYVSMTVFRENMAQVGGAIALLSSDTRSNSADVNLSKESTAKTIGRSPTAGAIVFENLYVVNNTAKNGGAVFIDSTGYEVPSFGKNCSFIMNFAEEFGGAVFFENYDDSQLIMTEAIFQQNEAFFGGCNAGFGYIQNASMAQAFCANCTFGTTGIVHNTSFMSYQDLAGFASVPTHLDFVDNRNPCPHNEYLDSSPTEIAVFLKDQFGTIVMGNYIEAFPTYIVFTPVGTNISISVTNNTEAIDCISGASVFDSFQMKGKNNSTAKLQFGVLQPYAINIVGTYCSVLLISCPPGQQIQEGDSFDSCITEMTPLNIALLTSGVLLLVIFSLLCIILAIILVFLSIRIRKKRKLMRLQSMEIPDFEGKPTPTLLEILNDPMIKRIPWRQIVLGETIGKGASGLVSRGVWTDDSGKQHEIALKELIMGFQDFPPEILDEFLIEIKFMSSLFDKNIVAFLGVSCPDNSKLYLITELMHHGSVRDLLDKKGRNLSAKLRLKFAKDAAKGMAHLHTKKLIHRDLKTHNLLVNNQWCCKVADFGISTVKPAITRTMTCIGTPIYMAPEVLSKNKYSEKADVYSFGIVLIELVTLRVPYSDKTYKTMNQAMLMYHIVNKGARPSLDGIHPAVTQLILDCWNEDPRLRPSFTEIIVRLRRMTPEEFSDQLLSPTGDDDIEREGSTTNSSFHSGELDLNPSDDDFKTGFNSGGVYTTPPPTLSNSFDGIAEYGDDSAPLLSINC